MDIKRTLTRGKIRLSDAVKKLFNSYSKEELSYLEFEKLLTEEAEMQKEIGSELHKCLIQYLMDNETPDTIPTLKDALRYGRNKEPDFPMKLSMHLQSSLLMQLASMFGEIVIDHDRIVLRRGGLMFNGQDRIYALGLLLDDRCLEEMEYGKQSDLFS